MYANMIEQLQRELSQTNELRIEYEEKMQILQHNKVCNFVVICIPKH